MSSKKTDIAMRLILILILILYIINKITPVDESLFKVSYIGATMLSIIFIILGIKDMTLYFKELFKHEDRIESLGVWLILLIIVCAGIIILFELKKLIF